MVVNWMGFRRRTCRPMCFAGQCVVGILVLYDYSCYAGAQDLVCVVKLLARRSGECFHEALIGCSGIKRTTTVILDGPFGNTETLAVFNSILARMCSKLISNSA